mmetsp:Transcript_25692/g.40045  ORF Transcript_25692/g.40045 Transcript_25692/m.40045 type:complete len:455 (-) Transcript_25692:134-1498(-)
MILRSTLRRFVATTRPLLSGTGSRESTKFTKQGFDRSMLPQILISRPYDKLRVLVLSYCKDRSEAAKVRALSTLNSTIMKLQDPGEIKQLLDVYRLLNSESSIPESVKHKALADDEQESWMKYIETSILSITTLRDRFEREKSQRNMKTLTEIRKHTEDPVYELAQFITTVSDIAYATFLTRFTDVADSTCLDKRALSVLLSEVKKRTSRHEAPDHIWMRTIRVLLLSRDFDRLFLVDGIEKIKRSLHLFDFMSCIRTAEYVLSCTGFEDFTFFACILDRLHETIGDAPTATLPRLYQAINMMGIYHFPLIKQLNQRYRLAFNSFSLEANVSVLDCLLSVPDMHCSSVIHVEPNHYNKDILKDRPLIMRLLDTISLTYDTLPWNDSAKVRQAKRLIWCLQRPEVTSFESRKEILEKLSQNILLWCTFNRSSMLLTASLIEQIAKITSVYRETTD